MAPTTDEVLKQNPMMNTSMQKDFPTIPGTKGLKSSPPIKEYQPPVIHEPVEEEVIIVPQQTYQPPGPILEDYVEKNSTIEYS